MYFTYALANIFRSTSAHRNELEKYSHSFTPKFIQHVFLKIFNICKLNTELNTKKKIVKFPAFQELTITLLGETVSSSCKTVSSSW